MSSSTISYGDQFVFPTILPVDPRHGPIRTIPGIRKQEHLAMLLLQAEVSRTGLDSVSDRVDILAELALWVAGKTCDVIEDKIGQ